MLTQTAARELGKGFRFLRHARQLTLRDVAKRAGLSAQYVQNIERGERTSTSDEAYEKLARGYEVPMRILADMILRARVMSALEVYGLTADQQRFVWRGVEQRMAESGVNFTTDLAQVVSEMLVESYK